MRKVALVFTYRSLPGLALTARELGMCDALLDAAHYGFVPVDGFSLADEEGEPRGALPAADVDLSFALDRWLLDRFLLPGVWGEVLRPDRRQRFRHGVAERRSIDEVRAELESAGYLVLDWASARAALRPERPMAIGAALLAAARAVVDAPSPAQMPVPKLPPQVDLNGPDDDEAIRVLARSGQLWRSLWFWNTAFNGDPDDVFRVQELAREGGATEHDWARFVALARQGASHPPLELWLISRLPGLASWLTRACAEAPADVPWIATAFVEALAEGGPWLEPLEAMRKKTLRELKKLARGAGPAPDVDAHVPGDAPSPSVPEEDPSYGQRLALLLLSVPGLEVAARRHLARAAPSQHGGATAGLIAIARLATGDAGHPPHLPDLGAGLDLLGWPAPADASVRDVQRMLRRRAHQLDGAIAEAARAQWAAVQAGVFGPPRCEGDDDGAIVERPRDVPALLASLLAPNAEHPALKAIEPVGELIVTSGHVSFTDPLTALLRPGFARAVPRGRHPVACAIDDAGRVGALIVHVRQRGVHTKPERWELATRPREDPATLRLGETFGYPVDGGIAAVFDVEAGGALAGVEGLYDTLIAPALRQARAATISAPGGGNAVVARSGDGDGFYTAWWGLDGEGRPRALVGDFRVFEVPETDAQREAWVFTCFVTWVESARTILDEAFGPLGFAPARSRVDLEASEVSVSVSRGSLRIELAASYIEAQGRLDDADCTLLAFVDDEEQGEELSSEGVPGFGGGPYASLATIDACLQRDAAAWFARLAS
ncbi:MAG: DUF4241 domain-containing protein [Polyangiaceae bacterium]|jgi:hypothetical protein|nr:DUF4241 domain-containing protein [Polyangiaceae bacterium]